VAHRYESGERVYKIIDFGLVAMRATTDQTRLTDPDFFLGTLAYAAPEQMRGEDITPAVDVYALGVIAYEMLTGARPFDSDNQATLITNALTVSPMSPATRRSGLPAAIDDAVMRALEKNPAARWPTVTEFIAALQEGAGAMPSAAVRIETEQADSGLLSRYELGPILSRGRLGSLVYSGSHRVLGIPVAIRVLKRENLPHWDAVRSRFLLEARTLQVPHPGLLQVRDFGEDDRGVFVVTDLVEGPSLRQAMAEAGAMAWPRAAALIMPALDAMAALNRRGGFICGVNPDMIRVRRDASGSEHLVMTTAGIKSVQDVLATMREQELRGQEASEQELPYIAPEVLMGGAPNVRADVFTIGVLAYQMVTGTMPFRAPSLPELLGQMLQVRPPSPAALNASVPAAAGAAILRAIDGVAASRFESAGQFAAAF
jgi:serine/threonine protein kinase